MHGGHVGGGVHAADGGLAFGARLQCLHNLLHARRIHVRHALLLCWSSPRKALCAGSHHAQDTQARARPPSPPPHRSFAIPSSTCCRRCYYLQAEAFQHATEVAVDRLHSSARGTAEQLGQLQAQAGAVIGATETILQEQAAASEAAQALLAGQREASHELGSLKASQAAAFMAAEQSLQGLGRQQSAALHELKVGTEELGAKQQSLLGGLDRLLALQSTLLGDFMDIKSLVFYVAAVILSLSLTSTPRTAAARLPLFLVLSLNVLALTTTLRLNSVLLSRLLVLEFPKRLFVVVSAAPADVKEDAMSIIRLNWKKV